jgi:hypothetical protein
LRLSCRKSVYLSEIDTIGLQTKEIAAMFSPNFQYLIYKQQEREYIREAQRLSLIRAAKNQSNAAPRQIFQLAQRFFEKLSGFVQSLIPVKTIGAGACCSCV